MANSLADFFKDLWWNLVTSSWTRCFSRGSINKTLPTCIVRHFFELVDTVMSASLIGCFMWGQREKPAVTKLIKMAERVELGSIQTLNFLLEKAVKFPNQQHSIIEEIISILRITNFDAKGLKTTLEFYKCLYPIAVVPLKRNLFARRVLVEEDFTESALPSFLAKVLFEVVTKSATDCAEYCANVWVERYATSRLILARPS